MNHENMHYFNIEMILSAYIFYAILKRSIFCLPFFVVERKMDETENKIRSGDEKNVN